MIEKDVAISILKDIQNSLNKDDWKSETLKTINVYDKNLRISINEKIKKLLEKQKIYVEKYGEEGKKTLKINKKIDEELKKIFTN